MKNLKEKFNNLNDKKKLASLFAIGSILLLTTAATYAFFTYSREGLKENTIESGAITFHYQEESRSISLTNAMPISDEDGMAQNNYFDFTITSKTSNTIKIPYYVTVRRKGNDNSLDNYVKFYLTEVNNNIETALTLDNNKQISAYGELATYINDSLNITAAKNEKSLYRAIVPANSSNYEKHYRLRMWLTDGLEFTQNVTGSCSDPTYTTEEACVQAKKDWTDVATTVEKEFTATVNVYGFGNMASNNANINEVLVNNESLTEIATNTYETEVVIGATSTTIDVETENDNAQVSITKTQSDYSTPIAMNNNLLVQRLSAIKSEIVQLTHGDNYFKILITSEDTTTNKELHLKISTTGLQGLAKMIYDNNTLITASPTLTTSSNQTSDASGLYKMSVTNGFGGANGDTYYFRGNVTNNYVRFANKIWRVIRINEDGTVRLILDGVIDEQYHVFNSNYEGYSYMYYSNSSAKTDVEAWYSTNITGTNAEKVASGNYFCEAAKVKRYNSSTSENATMTLYSSYTPDLVCNTDGNAKGLLNNGVGLINFDEVVLAGGYPYISSSQSNANSDYYLHKNYNWWTMSPAGVGYGQATDWLIYPDGSFNRDYVQCVDTTLSPVINLKANVIALGTGTESDPYVVQ